MGADELRIARRRRVRHDTVINGAFRLRLHGGHGRHRQPLRLRHAAGLPVVLPRASRTRDGRSPRRCDSRRALVVSRAVAARLPAPCSLASGSSSTPGGSGPRLRQVRSRSRSASALVGAGRRHPRRLPAPVHHPEARPGGRDRDRSARCSCSASRTPSRRSAAPCPIFLGALVTAASRATASPSGVAGLLPTARAWPSSSPRSTVTLALAEGGLLARAAPGACRCVDRLAGGVPASSPARTSSTTGPSTCAIDADRLDDRRRRGRPWSSGGRVEQPAWVAGPGALDRWRSLFVGSSRHRRRVAWSAAGVGATAPRAEPTRRPMFAELLGHPGVEEVLRAARPRSASWPSTAARSRR